MLRPITVETITLPSPQPDATGEIREVAQRYWNRAWDAAVARIDLVVDFDRDALVADLARRRRELLDAGVEIPCRVFVPLTAIEDLVAACDNQVDAACEIVALAAWQANQNFVNADYVAVIDAATIVAKPDREWTVFVHGTGTQVAGWFVWEWMRPGLSYSLCVDRDGNVARQVLPQHLTWAAWRHPLLLLG